MTNTEFQLKDFSKKEFLSNSTTIEEGCKVIRNHLTLGPSTHTTAGDGDLLWMLWEKLTAEVIGLHPAFTSQRGLGGLMVLEDVGLRESYKKAIESCPYFCVNIDKSCRQKLAWWALSTLGVLDSRPLISSQCVHRLNHHNQFFPIIDGKRVLLVAGFAEELCKVFDDKEFQKKHVEKGLDQGYEIVNRIVAPGKYSGSKTVFIEETKQKILDMKNDFDVLMTSAGASSVILCDYARSLGKVGFDMGANDLYILGRKSGNESWNWNVPSCDIRKKR